MDLTQEQIDQLQSLGIKVENKSIPAERNIPSISETPPTLSQPKESPNLPKIPLVTQNEKDSPSKVDTE
jgi:hypothetical protein